MPFATDVGKERRGGNGQDTGKEISSPAVAPSRRGGVRTVGADHVIDRRHVDAVVCNSHDGLENH